MRMLVYFGNCVQRNSLCRWDLGRDVKEGRDQAGYGSVGRGFQVEEKKPGVSFLEWCSHDEERVWPSGGPASRAWQSAGWAWGRKFQPSNQALFFLATAHIGCHFRERRGLTRSGVRNPGRSSSIPSLSSPLLPSLPPTTPSSGSYPFPLIFHTWSLASPFHSRYHCLGITLTVMFAITTAPYFSRYICRRAGISSGSSLSAQNL